MNCAPELVTGYVDGALDAAQHAEVEAHLASCDACRAQAAAEREVRGKLLSLLHPPLPAGFDEGLRKRLQRRPRVSIVRLLLPLAAAVLLAFAWLRQKPPAMAWQMARDHDHCFSLKVLPAQVWAEEAESVMRWFEARGTTMPVIPTTAGGFGLIGGRYCSLPDFTRAAHVYYRKEDRKGVSIFVIPRRLSMPEPSVYETRGHIVYLARMGDTTVAVVGDAKEDVQAFARTFDRTVAMAVDDEARFAASTLFTPPRIERVRAMRAMAPAADDHVDRPGPP
jgi:anti-sigma factor RsiW